MYSPFAEQSLIMLYLQKHGVINRANKSKSNSFELTCHLSASTCFRTPDYNYFILSVIFLQIFTLCGFGKVLLPVTIAISGSMSFLVSHLDRAQCITNFSIW